jgi:hypothetical protein
MLAGVYACIMQKKLLAMKSDLTYLAISTCDENSSCTLCNFMVRQAKPGGSSQLKGTDHGNCSLAM